jgi:hypothetical protein
VAFRVAPFVLSVRNFRNAFSAVAELTLHSCASVLPDAGENIEAVGDYVGHADPAFPYYRWMPVDAGVPPAMP